MSRVFYKKKNSQRLAAFQSNRGGIKHGTQAWPDDGSGRVMHQFNTFLSEGTPWEDRWMTSEAFREFESARRKLKVRHRRGEHIGEGVTFEAVLSTEIAKERGKLPEVEICETPQKTESVGRRNPGRFNPGVSGSAAYA